MVKYKKLEELKVKIFADGADFENIKLSSGTHLAHPITTFFPTILATILIPNFETNIENTIYNFLTLSTCAYFLKTL